MNWKLILSVTAALLLGLTLSPFEHGKVSAAVTAPYSTHFQLLSATVDEIPANGTGPTLPFGPTNTVAPYHELFLLDTESGKVWEYAPGATVTKPDGSKHYYPSMFIPIERAPQN